MKAEIQFFAMPADIDKLLDFVKEQTDAIEDKYCLLIGDCKITLTASTLQGKILLVGSVAINTGSVDDACVDQERAKKVYRSLRKWVKKNYSNQLYTYMLEGDRKDTAARNHWISPAAVAWKKDNPERLLKLYNTSPMVFEIMVVSHQMGELVPVESNKVRGHG